jgi:hypothetical protein
MHDGCIRCIKRMVEGRGKGQALIVRLLPNTACTRSPAKYAGTGGGSLRIFNHFVWLEASSVKAALPCLAHQRVPRENHTGQAANRWATSLMNKK